MQVHVCGELRPLRREVKSRIQITEFWESISRCFHPPTKVDPTQFSLSWPLTSCCPLLCLQDSSAVSLARVEQDPTPCGMKTKHKRNTVGTDGDTGRVHKHLCPRSWHWRIFLRRDVRPVSLDVCPVIQQMSPLWTTEASSGHVGTSSFLLSSNRPTGSWCLYLPKRSFKARQKDCFPRGWISDEWTAEVTWPALRGRETLLPFYIMYCFKGKDFHFSHCVCLSFFHRLLSSLEPRKPFEF